MNVAQKQLRASLGLAAVASLLIGLLEGCGSGGGLKWRDGNPAWSPDGRKIAFDSDRTDPKNRLKAIYVMSADGTGVRRLTHGPLDAERPRWSPDGTRVVYIDNLLHVQNQYGSKETVYSDQASIHVVHADGTGDKMLAFSRNTSNVDWSPDGGWIAFDAGRVSAETQSLEIVRPNGVGLRRVTADASEFSWSPDGKQLVFTRSHYRDGLAVYLVHVDSGKTTRLARLFVGDAFTDVSWSPDGAQIAFIAGSISTSGDALENGRAYVINSNGVNIHAVGAPNDFPKYNDFISGVAWLPGSAHVLLYNTDDGYYKASTRMQRSRRLNASQGSAAVLSPDGTEFLFTPYTRSGKNAIFLQRINGSARQLTQTREVESRA